MADSDNRRIRRRQAQLIRMYFASYHAVLSFGVVCIRAVKSLDEVGHCMRLHLFLRSSIKVSCSQPKWPVL